MVPDTRALLPTDLPALLARRRSLSYENAAWPKERLRSSEPQPALGVLRDQLLAFGMQRAVWVTVRRRKLQALVSMRTRGGHKAWELEYLVDCDGGDTIVAGLLSRAIQAAGEAGAEKVFLRLASDSDLLRAAQEAGFVSYQAETLYRLLGSLDAEPVECRAMTPSDGYPVFRLYSASTPEVTRRHEAVTYGEWQASIERRWLKNGVELIREHDQSITGVVRANRLSQGILVELMLGEASEPEALGLIAAACEVLGKPAAGKEPVLVLAGSGGYVRRLEDAGFEAGGEFISLVHRTARPLSLPKAVPAVAKNVVGV